MKKGKKILKGTMLVLGILLLIVLLILFPKLRTMSSFRQISDAPAYEMSYYGTFEMKKYLKTGATSIQELRGFLMKQFSYGLSSVLDTDHGCSAFFATTPEGDLILARNFDTPDGVGCMLDMDNTDGNSFLGMSNISWLSQQTNKNMTSLKSRLMYLASPYVMTDGMNQYGLTFALFTANGSKTASDPDKITLYDTTVPAAVLSQTKTVDEAVEFLKTYNIKMASSHPSHYMICDAEGNSVVVEFVKGEMKVIPMTGNYQICTNILLSYDSAPPSERCSRYNNYETALKASNGIITEEDAMKLLIENTIPGDEHWSAIYNLTKKTVKISFFGDYENVYEYTLN